MKSGQEPAATIRRSLLVSTFGACACVVGLVCANPSRALSQSNPPLLSQEAACQALTPASAGGLMPKSPAVFVLRWLGVANYELAYRDTVILLDAAYSRVAPARPIGFAARDVNRANAIFVGHPHGDHVWDLVEVAKRTGARVYGGPQTVEYLRSAGVDEAQATGVKGGEIVKFNGVTVEPILFHHSLPRPPEVQKAMAAYPSFVAEIIRKRTPEEEAQAKAIGSRGARGPNIDTTGTFAYLFTFDNGFRLMYTDSAGPPTDALKRVMARISRTDVALVAYQGRFLAARQDQETMPLVRLFNPRVVLPTHHDDESGVGSHVDMPIYPLAMAIRDELPETRTISPLYRTPVCFDIQSREVLVAN